jgi:hypothetical protein
VHMGPAHLRGAVEVSEIALWHVLPCLIFVVRLCSRLVMVLQPSSQGKRTFTGFEGMSYGMINQGPGTAQNRSMRRVASAAGKPS